MNEFVKRIVKPAAVAMAAAGVIAVFAVALSRVLLAVPEAGSTIIAFLMAGMILAVIAVIAFTGSTLNAGQKVVAGFAGLGLVGAGIAGGALGVREIEAHLEEVELAAQNTAFESGTLTLPADTEVALAFTNRDAGVDHNVEIYPDDTFSGEALFEGEIFPGVATVTYELPALAAGEYSFWCVVHKLIMRGTVVVAEEGEGEPEEPVGEPTQPRADEEPSADAAEVAITAENIDYSTDSLTFPTDTPVALTFENRDQVLHNVDIYADDTFSGEPLFSGEVFGGPDTRVYAIDPLEAGTYAFRCLVHPVDMTGTLTVE